MTPPALKKTYAKLAQTKGRKVRSAWLAWNRLDPRRPDRVPARSLSPRARAAQKRWKSAHDAWMGAIESAERRFASKARRTAHHRKSR
jgi:hypothetical protein